MLRNITWFVFAAGLFSPFSIAENPADTSQPQILNYYPRCEYNIKEQVLLSESSFVALNEMTATELRLKKQLTQQLRQLAAEKSAAAIIVVKLDTEKITHNNFITQQNNNNVMLKLRLKAELVESCEESTNSAQIHTPYNNKLERIISNQRFTLKPLILQSLPPKPLNSSEQLPTVNTNISLSEGFYGAKLGLSPADIMTKFGRPTAEFTLSNDIRALTYGRTHWFLFQQEELIAVKQQAELLTSFLVQHLSADSRFDQQNWKIDNIFTLRSSAEAINAHYGKALQRHANDIYTLQKGNAQLYLHFNVYLNIESAKSETKLAHVALEKADTANLQLQLLTTASEQILPVLDAFANSSFNRNAFTEQLSKLPQHHRIIVDSHNHIAVYNSVFAVQYNDNKPSDIRLQAFFTNTNAEKLVTRYLQRLKQPHTKAQFLAAYPDALDISGELHVFGERYDIRATYENDAAEKLDSMHFKLHY